MTKTRWLKIDSSDKESYKKTLALINTIETVEQIQRDGHVYVRFVTSRKRKRRLVAGKLRVFSSSKNLKRNQNDTCKARQYCAVILK